MRSIAARRSIERNSRPLAKAGSSVQAQFTNSPLERAGVTGASAEDVFLACPYSAGASYRGSRQCTWVVDGLAGLRSGVYCGVAFSVLCISVTVSGDWHIRLS
jgi:hypothetical protein